MKEFSPLLIETSEGKAGKRERERERGNERKP